MALQLISLDFDGTIAIYEPELAVAPEIIPLLERAADAGIRWLLNSDRWIEELEDIVEALDERLRPCAILTRQKDIFLLAAEEDGGGYEPLEEWNDAQEVVHRAIWQDVTPFFAGWEREIRERFKVKLSFVMDQVFAFCVPPEETPALVGHVRECIHPWPELQISGNHEWVFVIHATFSKARLLVEAARQLDIPAADILAVGDGLNDVSIFTERAVGMSGCPGDACAEMLAAVRAGNGYVARGDNVAGTGEVLTYFLARQLSEKDPHDSPSN